MTEKPLWGFATPDSVSTQPVPLQAALRQPIPIFGGATYTDWRLPSQKEALQIYQSGIRGLNQTGNLTTHFGSIDGWFWTSSTASYGTGNAWEINFSGGYTVDISKNDPHRVICVR
jgi:hypothetical protein